MKAKKNVVETAEWDKFRLEIYLSKQVRKRMGELTIKKEVFRWCLTSANNEIIVNSSEAFDSKQACKNNLRLVRDALSKLPVY